MSDLDTFSDAQLLMKFWWKTLRLQENRLVDPGSKSLSADARFAVIAATMTVQCCELFTRFDVPGVADAIAEFRTRQPAARAVRNAIEHFDEYLVGEGGKGSARLGRVWFPYGLQRGEGQVVFHIPPLPGHSFPDGFDVTQLVSDALWLHTAVAKAIDDDWPRRFRNGLE